jgi:ribonuclease BN (tRNA processing enzyme)
MLVRVVGSGDAFGSGGRFQTCLWMRAADHTLLVDCGATSLVAMRRLGITPDVDAVVLTTYTAITSAVCRSLCWTPSSTGTLARC